MTGLSNGSTHMDAGNQGIPAERSGDNANGRSADAAGVAGVVGGGSHSGVTPIPSSIVQSICQIMATVEAVKKSAFNEHGKYKFSSTDDLYAALSRKMGECGVICMALEERCEIKRFEAPIKERGAIVRDKDGNPAMQTVQWAHIEYSFVWATTSDTWTDRRAKRTIYIQVTGPQTFQAAQSFIEKAYLRSTFKIPSGDMDLDSMPQFDNEDDANASIRTRLPRKASAEGKRDGSVDIFNQLRGRIANATNAEDLQSIYVEHCDRNGPWSGMPPRWADMLQDDYEVKRDGFTAIQAAE